MQFIGPYETRKVASIPWSVFLSSSVPRSRSRIFLTLPTPSSSFHGINRRTSHSTAKGPALGLILYTRARKSRSVIHEKRNFRLKLDRTTFSRLPRWRRAGKSKSDNASENKHWTLAKYAGIFIPCCILIAVLFSRAYTIDTRVSH